MHKRPVKIWMTPSAPGVQLPEVQDERLGQICPLAKPSADVGTEAEWARLMDGFERHLRAEKGSCRPDDSQLPQRPAAALRLHAGRRHPQHGTDRPTQPARLSGLADGVGLCAFECRAQAQHCAQLASLAAAPRPHPVRSPAQARCRQERQAASQSSCRPRTWPTAS